MVSGFVDGRLWADCASWDQHLQRLNGFNSKQETEQELLSEYLVPCQKETVNSSFSVLKQISCQAE